MVGFHTPIIVASNEVVSYPDLFVPFIEDGFLARARADLLSILSSTASASLPSSSPTSVDSHRA